MQADSECEVSEDCTYCNREEVWHELPFHNSRRRASLEEASPVKKYSNERCGRRLSIGNVTTSSTFCSRRSSLGEEVLRLNFLRINFSNSFTSLADSSRRPSLDSDGSAYEPRRRSSLGAESLVESDVEDELDSNMQGEPPPEAVLGLQYVDDVFAVKRDLEIRYHPRNCLNAQPQVSAPARCTLVNWLVKVNRQLQFGSETVFLAVNLLDRFLACSAIASDCAQLLAVCSLFVAGKMEESKVPGIGGLSVLCSSSFQRHHFRRMEILLLTKLGFALHAPSSWYFINYLALKACQLGYLDRTVCRFARRVAETCLCRYDIAQFLPSIQAAAALVYAVTAMNPQESSRFQPALLHDGVWAQQCRDTIHSEENCNSSAEELVQQAFVTSLEGMNYSAQFQLPDRIEDPLEDFSLIDNAYFASSLQQSVFDDIMHHKETNSETSSSAVMELINVLMILFSFHERCEIVHCSDLMKKHFASYDEQQRAALTPIVELCTDAAELYIASDNSRSSITAQTLLCCSSGCNNFEASACATMKYSSSASGVPQNALPKSSVVEIVPVAYEERDISTKSSVTLTTITLSVSSCSCRIGPRYLPVAGIIARVRPTTLDFTHSTTQSLQSSDYVNWSRDLSAFNQCRRDSGISTSDFESNV